MSEALLRMREENAEELKRVAKAGRKSKAVPRPKSRRASKRALSVRQRVGLAVGGTGCSVLGLSVWHCTEAISLLTGSPTPLAAMLAVGIDAGMVACEVAGVVGGKGAARAARWYVGLAVALSAALNAVASGQHAAEGFTALAYGVGALVPVLVLILGMVASKLWTETE